MASSGLSAQRLELEITETAMLQDAATTLAILRELKALGVSISLDDFGAGYSSLSYLQKFPFDKLKIDRSFVRELSSRSDSAAIVRAVIGLGMVIAAYMAEAVRGGLQAVPEGQHEAATALGLGYWRSTGFIVLPQAIRIALPAMTNEFIALVKNTTLVLIVSILDLLGIAQAALADPNWVGMNKEAYAFAGLLYWLGCFSLSRVGLALERSRSKGERH